MMARSAAGVILGTALTIGSIAQAQTPTPNVARTPAAGQAAPGVTEKTAPAAAPPKKPGQLVNIRIECTITETRTGTTPTKRTVSLIVADGEAGSVRSEPAAFQVPGVLQLNVDARPQLAGANKIRLTFSLQYSGPAQGTLTGDTPRGTILTTNLRESLSLIADDDKPLLVAQSADPTSDRAVTVEVKATILK